MTLEDKLAGAIAMKQGFAEGTPGYLACQDEEMRIRRQLGDSSGPAPARTAGGPRANRVGSSGPRGFVEIDQEWADGGMMHDPGYRDNRAAFDPAFVNPDRSEFVAYDGQVVMPPRVHTSAQPPIEEPRGPPEDGSGAMADGSQLVRHRGVPRIPRARLGAFRDTSVGRFLISRFESPQAAMAWGVTAASIVYSGMKAYKAWKKKKG